jgi:hypothetical protein
MYLITINTMVLEFIALHEDYFTQLVYYIILVFHKKM